MGSGSLVWKQINSVSASAANASAALLNSCGNVSTSATVTISPHTASTTVSTSATVTTTLSSGPSQAKAKAKKKSQQERNTKTVDVESVAGYRGKDPVEELVKYIESSSEDKQGVGSGSKSGDKKKERKKDKEKHQKLKKSNSLEELRSGAKMEVHELKRTAATTESNTVLGRQKSGGGKQNKNNSSSTADINKNLDSKNQTQSGNSRKSDRRSWGNEDLKYLNDQQNANLANEDKTNTSKDRRNKVSLIGISTSSKDEKETKDKTSDRNELNLTNNISSTTQNDEKLDKIEKSDKFEKIDNKMDKFEKRKRQEIPPNAVTVVDIQAIESALPETAEFHVVTKKKKAKKQKVINNLEETTVTFNRTHNFTMQKTSTFNQQQQQMTVRYKYYHHDNLNSTNTSISNANTNSQNHQHLSSQFQQHQHQHQQSSNYNSNAGVTNSHHQSQQIMSDNFSNSDKSRRKSTSSVPPSEKSDSSDLDSVHSLPIESTKQTNVSNTLKEGTQLRAKDSKNNNTTLGNNNFTLCKSQNAPAPVSYADIARTNKEITDAVGAASASGILINNNEIPTECRNADTTTQNANVTESFNDDKPTAVNTAMGVTAPTSLSKLHKIKKSQIKQDFPELVGSSVISDDKIASSNVNHKTITYSQSLTAVKHPHQNAALVLSHGSGFNSANESSSLSTDFNTKASPTELHKNSIVHQHIPPLQYPQQLVLQKSKSVDNDSIALTNSSSSIIYMASLNCNNLDQQYPALEKTVKRHSSSNVTLNTNASNYSSVSSVNTTNSATNQTTFNFAAAAKQQIALSNNEQHNINLNKNLALTTSNTNNTIQTALQTNANSNVNAVGVNVNSGTLATAMTNKKSKEKTPPLSSNSTQLLQNVSQDFNATNSIINTNITTLSSTVVTNSKKSKKERLLHQQHVLLDNTQTKQNNNNNNNNSNVSSRKTSKTQLKYSTSLPLGITTSSSTSSSLASSCANTISINRPAVIILNDDRNSTNCAANNQFTFGDFNEEELKLFDDDNNVTENTLEIINTNVISCEEEKHHRSASDAVTKTPSTSYFNDSGTSCGSEMTNNSTSDMLLSSSMEALSPNTSFATISHTVSGGGVNNMSAPCNNQSSDSGIYTEKTQSSNIICNSSNSSSCGNENSGNISSKHSKQQQTVPRNEDDNKLNTFLSNTRCTSVQTSLDNLEPPPPPQQLETCNDIETAIIAAARAAAKHQQPAHHQLQQQQQYKNSNASSSSSSFSSSSLTSSSTSSVCQNYNQHHNNNNNNNNNNSKRNYPNQIVGSGNILPSTYPHQSQQQHEEDYEDDNESYINMPRSRSPSRPRRISIAGGTVANKEFDIHFIPPTTMPTAFSTQQHNDIIIDFIGSGKCCCYYIQ